MPLLKMKGMRSLSREDLLRKEAFTKNLTS
jgi:hypothetical protein